MGKDVKEVTALFGEPDRIDVSAYGYDWWIYDQGVENYMQVAVQDEQVVSIYALGTELIIQPLAIGQRIDEVYQSFNPEMTVDVVYEDTTFQFELNEEDLGMRPLIKIGDIYAQVYVDKFTGLVSSVRFLTAEVLVMQRPYEMIYRGELPEAEELQEEEWLLVDQGNEQQILSITNIIRSRFGLNQVEWDEQTAEVARTHSLDMFENAFFAHESPNNGNLSDRLETGGVVYQEAGENIAAKYVDGISAFEGWLNSKGHRDTLLNGDFTDLGVGVYRN
ncbi:MAG: CAP domain-containing protein, partial [Bacillus sp. (in: firmicutes)]